MFLTGEKVCEQYIDKYITTRYNHYMRTMDDISSIKTTLNKFKKEGKITIAILFGSYAKNLQHVRSDIDLALYIKAQNQKEETEIIDKILISSDKEIEILRLNDENEDQFVVQEALDGIHLIEPDEETLYALYDRALHETESIRFRRKLSVG